MVKSLSVQVLSKYKPLTLLNGWDIMKKQQNKADVWAFFEHIRIPVIGQKVHKLLNFFLEIFLSMLTAVHLQVLSQYQPVTLLNGRDIIKNTAKKADFWAFWAYPDSDYRSESAYIFEFFWKYCYQCWQHLVYNFCQHVNL